MNHWVPGFTPDAMERMFIHHYVEAVEFAKKASSRR